MATADTEEKDNFLINLMNQMGPGGKNHGPWIGGMKDGKSWVWLKTGEIFAYTNWGSGQPDHDNEKCLHYWTYSSEKWNNAPCSMAFEFLCEKPASI